MTAELRDLALSLRDALRELAADHADLAASAAPLLPVGSENVAARRAEALANAATAADRLATALR